MYQDKNGFWHQDYAGESVPCSSANAFRIMQLREQIKKIRKEEPEYTNQNIADLLGVELHIVEKLNG